MKLMRRRKPSLKTALGVTKAKRRLAKMTGIFDHSSQPEKCGFDAFHGYGQLDLSLCGQGFVDVTAIAVEVIQSTADDEPQAVKIDFLVHVLTSHRSDGSWSAS